VSDLVEWGERCCSCAPNDEDARRKKRCVVVMWGDHTRDAPQSRNMG
jgi:hypothetical protein